MGSLRLILGLALTLAIASFGVINMEPVTVAYYRGTLRLPLFYALLAVFGGGFLIAWFGGLFDRLRFHRQIHSLKRQVHTLEKNVASAREEAGRLLAAPAAASPEDALPPAKDSSADSSALPSGAASGPDPAKEEDKDAPAS